MKYFKLIVVTFFLLILLSENSIASINQIEACAPADIPPSSLSTILWAPKKPSLYAEEEFSFFGEEIAQEDGLAAETIENTTLFPLRPTASIKQHYLPEVRTPVKGQNRTRIRKPVQNTVTIPAFQRQLTLHFSLVGNLCASPFDPCAGSKRSHAPESDDEDDDYADRDRVYYKLPSVKRPYKVKPIKPPHYFFAQLNGQMTIPAMLGWPMPRQLQLPWMWFKRARHEKELRKPVASTPATRRPMDEGALTSSQDSGDATDSIISAGDDQSFYASSALSVRTDKPVLLTPKPLRRFGRVPSSFGRIPVMPSAVKESLEPNKDKEPYDWQHHPHARFDSVREEIFPENSPVPSPSSDVPEEQLAKIEEAVRQLEEALQKAAEEESIRLKLDALSPSPTPESLAVIDEMILGYQCVEAIPTIILNKYYPDIIGGTKSYLEAYARLRLRYSNIPLTFSAKEYPGRTLMNKVKKLREILSHLKALDLFPVQTAWRNREFIVEANECIARFKEGLAPRSIRWNTLREDGIPHFGWSLQGYAQDGKSCRMCDEPAVCTLKHSLSFVKTAHACGDCARIMRTSGKTLLEMLLKSKATACASSNSTEITDNILDLPDDEFVDPAILALKLGLS